MIPRIRFDVEQSVARRFEETVSAYPELLAVGFENQLLTYRDLDRAANAVARAIIALRGTVAEPVALFFGQEPHSIIAILGVLKAGKIYVPIDPSFPRGRNNLILADSEAAVILTNHAYAAAAKSLAPDLPAIDLDELELAPGCDALDLPIAADALAYILSTSGSTGRPKGIVQTQRNVLAAARRFYEGLALGPSDRLSMLPSYSVTASVGNIFGALLCGASVYPFDVKRRGVTELGPWLVTNAITVYRSVPTVFRHLAATLHEEHGFPDLRLIRLGGETLYWRDVKLFQRYFSSNCVLYNGYGSSELSNAWQFRIDHATEIGEGPVPVGFPTDETTFALHDESGIAVPTGSIGEIVVTSRYLSPGYWRKPELTAAVFASDPNVRDLRTYRTGDLGYLLPDGALVHVGRKDFQVKIRGFRVELSEIEHALLEVDAVAETVVAAWDDDGEQRLVAYVVLHPAAATTAHELRGMLHDLPAYMIPASFVFLDALPLTPNAKLDRTALPRPTRDHDSRANYVAPRTPIEVTVAEIWSEVLGLERVGVDDNFFDLGGHSLNATQITSRLEARFDHDVTLAMLFTSPTIAGLASAISRTDRHAKRLAAPLRSDESIAPLSFSQSRLWILDRLQPGNSAYNICEAMRVRGALDVDTLQTALGAILDRHAVLRTAIESIDDEPVQKICPPRSIELPVVDLTAAPDPSAEAERLALVDAHRPFDLASEVVLRATLFRLSDFEHVLAIVVHHIAFDVWSAQVLRRELASTYEAFARAEPMPLPELPLQYVDFARWQRGLLRDDSLDNQLVYWRQQLRGAPALLDLPTDRPRPATQSFRGASETIVISRALRESLKDLGRQYGATLFMTLLAAFDVLLHRYSGSDDIVVATPVAGRNRPEFENLIGFFVNSLVLRSHVESQAPFRVLLRDVAATAVEALANQDVPFEKLVEELHPARDLSRNPLFQVMFALQNIPTADVTPTPETIRFERFRVPKSSAKFDLFIACEEVTHGLTVSAEYATDLFDASTIRRMLGHFEVLLQSIVTDPDRAIARLPMISTVERHELVTQWNQTQTTTPAPACVHALFEQRAAHTPNAIALEFGASQLTYGEVNVRANKVAHFLRASIGARPETLVGVCFDRSVDMIVAMLATLKAGLAYVPLDPTYPPERLAYIIDDAEIALVLTHESQHALPANVAQIVRLDTDWPAISRASGENPAGVYDASQLAYAIYTSGSTGTPKGVAISHRSLANVVAAIQRCPGFGERDSMLAITTISFDIAALEIFLPLVAGGRIVLARSDESSDPEKLSHLLRSSGVTTMQATPATWRMLLDSGWEGASHLTAFCGGEALSADLADRLRARCGALWNMYGPTETTIWSCLMPIETPFNGTVPIGFPIANTQAYVLDSEREPVPIGIPGDLYLAGDGLARGYVNRPELTAEKFVANPFAEVPQARMYATGDRARYRHDGALEFLGRNDAQLKIRGFRIEPGEIEVALRRYPGVRDAVVVAREDVPGEKQLIAYVAAAREDAVDASDLRSFLQATLPAYLVPSLFVTLSTLPKTANGKVDRRALPAPAQSAAPKNNEFVAPGTERELQLAAIWREVLKLESIGMSDNFFLLGGHSLNAIQVVTRVRKIFAIELSMRSIFEKPTLRAMSDQIDLLMQGPTAAMTPIRRLERRPRLPTV